MYRITPTGTPKSADRKDGVIPFKTPTSRPHSTVSARAAKVFEAAVKRKEKIAKGIWIFVVISCVTGCLGQVFTFLEIFWKYPTIIDIETEKTDDLQFPAVTVCNMNRFRLTEWCRFKNVDIESCNGMDSALLGNVWFKFVADDLFTLNRSIKIQMGHQLKTMVLETKKTVNGTVDVVLENGGFREHFFHQQYSNCFVYNAEWSGSGMGDRESARQIDIEFTIFLEPKEYLNAKEIPSAQIVFHHPECIPDPQENGIPIRSGYAHTFTLRHLVTRRLTYPYWTDCRNYDIVRRDRYIIQMTKSLCDRECAFNASLLMCRCVRRDIALPYEVDWDKEPSGKRRFCDHDITFTRCWVRVLDEVEKCIEKRCKRQCWEDQYEVSVTQDPWPDPYFFEEEKEKFAKIDIGNFREARMNLTRIKIIFGTLNKVTYRHRAKYEQIELFSYMGGFIGIWVGISFLNVLDYGTTFVNWLIRRIHKYREDKKLAEEKDDTFQEDMKH